MKNGTGTDKWSYPEMLDRLSDRLDRLAELGTLYSAEGPRLEHLDESARIWAELNELPLALARAQREAKLAQFAEWATLSSRLQGEAKTAQAKLAQAQAAALKNASILTQMRHREVRSGSPDSDPEGELIAARKAVQAINSQQSNLRDRAVRLGIGLQDQKGWERAANRAALQALREAHEVIQKHSEEILSNG